MVESFTLTKNHGIQLFDAKNNENLEIINDKTKNSNSPLDILFLIPHPFYQDRGSPIADNLVLKFLSQQNDKIDVVTYPQGKDVDYKNTNIYRTINIPFVKNVRPGFSWKKIIYDLLMFLEVARLLSKKRYSLIHAVEESVFIALLL
ncbi:MAG: hypothetical protein F6K13_11210, partial [Okeania sp. SIO2B9]|nr:hypothetical protein [Okeania sp. SIO2B9]